VFSFHEEATIDMRKSVHSYAYSQTTANRISDLLASSNNYRLVCHCVNVSFCHKIHGVFKIPFWGTHSSLKKAQNSSDLLSEACFTS
jgi:hypothetical protein